MVFPAGRETAVCVGFSAGREIAFFSIGCTYRAPSRDSDWLLAGCWLPAGCWLVVFFAIFLEGRAIAFSGFLLAVERLDCCLSGPPIGSHSRPTRVTGGLAVNSDKVEAPSGGNTVNSDKLEDLRGGNTVNSDKIEAASGGNTVNSDKSGWLRHRNPTGTQRGPDTTVHITVKIP